jgi:hypothetical protein
MTCVWNGDVGLDGDAAMSLFQKMRRETVPEGTTIFKQGANTEDGMLVILKGSVGVFASPDLTIVPRATQRHTHSATSNPTPVMLSRASSSGKDAMKNHSPFVSTSSDTPTSASVDTAVSLSKLGMRLTGGSHDDMEHGVSISGPNSLESDSDNDTSSVITADSMSSSHHRGGFAHRPSRPSRKQEVLCTLGVGQTIGEVRLAQPSRCVIVRLLMVFLHHLCTECVDQWPGRASSRHTEIADVM